MKTQNIIFHILIMMFVFIYACGSTSSGTSGSNTLSISGTVSVPSTQTSQLKFAFSSTGLDGAHVNVCTVQNGALSVLSGQSSVLADSSGAFTISIDVNDIPSNHQMWVCASPPNSSDYTVLAPIPEDSLPTESNEVTTVSIDPNTNTTIITHYACGQNVMLYNANKCLAVDEAELQTLNAALNTYFQANSGTTPDLSSLSTLLSNIANDNNMHAVLSAWLSEVDDVSYDDFVSDAQNFTDPTIPDPSSGGSGSVDISGFTCDLSSADGITTASIAVAGTAGSGNIDVFTVFFVLSGSDLSSPDSLGCGNWSQTGGLGSCTKSSVSADTTNFIGTSEVLYNTGYQPASIQVQVKGYQSGSSTVLASDTQTVACD